MSGPMLVSVSCSICGKPIDSLAADPSKWGLELEYEGGNGDTKWYHRGCVAEAIATRLQLPELQGRLEAQRNIGDNLFAQHEDKCRQIERYQQEIQKRNDLLREAGTHLVGRENHHPNIKGILERIHELAFPHNRIVFPPVDESTQNLNTA